MSEGKAVATREESSLIFQTFDRLDDEIIIAEIQNRVVETWVYHFTQKDSDREIWGLSKKGVDQALLEIERSGVVYEEECVDCKPDPTNPEFVLFSAKVRRFRYTKDFQKVDMGSATGYKRQWLHEILKDRSTRPDPFWYEKGAAKAIRNAKSRTIPTEVEAMIIVAAKSETNRVKKISDKDLDSEKKTNGGSNKGEPKPATENQIGYIKGLVEKKLQGDWAVVCKQYDLSTKEDLLKIITVSDANEIIEWLKEMK